MSKDWAQDIIDMHAHYGVHDWMRNNVDSDLNREHLFFRMRFLDEELEETWEAVHSANAEEVVDGLIDLVVVAIGTLDAMGVDPHRAWDEVHRANMAKQVGIKESRPNPLGLPDLVKPEEWVAPSHEGNHGRLASITVVEREDNDDI